MKDFINNECEHEELLRTPLTFEIIGDGKINWNFYCIKKHEGSPKTIEYSKNGGEWVEITSSNDDTSSIPVTLGDIVQFRGNNASYSALNFKNYFSCDATRFNIKGNIMSLIDSTNFSGLTVLESEYTFGNLFKGCKGLTDASKLLLPATTLANHCYDSMFSYCESLTTAPELPATTLANYCYDSMFDSCTSLTTAPELPATTLADGCYAYMFCGCTSLTTAPELPATTLASECYYYMFVCCESLTMAPKLPATTLAPYCYGRMFYNCTSLVNAPELPATTLVDGCYQHMFFNCVSLTTAPELPATTLVDECYYGMFRDCISLNYIKCLATDISANNCTYDLSCNVASGTFVKNPNMNNWITGYSGIPNGWTVQDA